jgi:hypothetical protein
MTGNRAVKYRRLALASNDPETTRLLCQLADEADRGVLVTADWYVASPSAQSDPGPVASDVATNKTSVPIHRT